MGVVFILRKRVPFLQEWGQWVVREAVGEWGRAVLVDVRQQSASTKQGKKAAVELLLCPQKCIWDVVAGAVAW